MVHTAVASEGTALRHSPAPPGGGGHIRRNTAAQKPAAGRGLVRTEKAERERERISPLSDKAHTALWFGKGYIRKSRREDAHGVSMRGVACLIPAHLAYPQKRGRVGGAGAVAQMEVAKTPHAGRCGFPPRTWPPVPGPRSNLPGTRSHANGAAGQPWSTPSCEPDRQPPTTTR